MKFRERLYALLLASVFMPMLLLAPFHNHEDHHSRHTEECECCINHIPHTGHISDDNPLPQCVLCNFVWAQYLPEHQSHLTVYEAGRSTVSQSQEDIVPYQFPFGTSPRAPPVSFC